MMKFVNAWAAVCILGVTRILFTYTWVLTGFLYSEYHTVQRRITTSKCIRKHHDDFIGCLMSFFTTSTCSVTAFSFKSEFGLAVL